MNYRHVYMLIIEHAKSEMKQGLRPKTKYYRKNFPNQYFEFHHILPKSLFPNWGKKTENLVCLTAREHFFCHQLLTKIHPCHEMFKALSIFCKFKQDQRQLTSRQYQICREAANQANLLWWNNQTNKERVRQNCIGRKLSEATKAKIRETKKLNTTKKHWYTNGIVETFTCVCPDGFHIGRKPFSDEAKENIRKGAIGNKSTKGQFHWTNGIDNTVSVECPGDGWYRGVTRHLSNETLKLISEHNRIKNYGRKWWTNGIITKYCKECPGQDFVEGRKTY